MTYIKRTIFLILILNTLSNIYAKNITYQINDYDNFEITDFNSEFVFENIKHGSYEIYFYFSVLDEDKLRTDHIAYFTANILITDGKKEINEKIDIILENGSTGYGISLFQIPKDFWFYKDITIKVLNLEYSNNIFEYHDSVSIKIKRFTGFLK